MAHHVIRRDTMLQRPAKNRSVLPYAVTYMNIIAFEEGQAGWPPNHARAADKR